MFGRQEVGISGEQGFCLSGASASEVNPRLCLFCNPVSCPRESRSLGCPLTWHVGRWSLPQTSDSQRWCRLGAAGPGELASVSIRGGHARPACVGDLRGGEVRVPSPTVRLGDPALP